MDVELTRAYVPLGGHVDIDDLTRVTHCTIYRVGKIGGLSDVDFVEVGLDDCYPKVERTTH